MCAAKNAHTKYCLANMWLLPTNIAQPCGDIQENYITLVWNLSAIRKSSLVWVLCTMWHSWKPPKNRKIIVKRTLNRAKKLNKTCEITTCVSRDWPPCCNYLLDSGKLYWNLQYQEWWCMSTVRYDGMDYFSKSYGMTSITSLTFRIYWQSLNILMQKMRFYSNLASNDKYNLIFVLMFN